jgi:hypothetical protein
VSLRDFVQGAGAAESELVIAPPGHHHQVREALSLARPLASVNDEALQRVHPGQQTEYRYKFSEVPFAGRPSPTRCLTCCATIRASTRPPRTTITGRCRMRTA